MIADDMASHLGFIDEPYNSYNSDITKILFYYKLIRLNLYFTTQFV